jgi:hypothetical protein
VTQSMFCDLTGQELTLTGDNHSGQPSASKL